MGVRFGEGYGCYGNDGWDFEFEVDVMFFEFIGM